MAVSRMIAVFGLAAGMILSTDGQARADEVAAPMGTKIAFTTTPGVTDTAIQPVGSYAVPDGWSKDYVEVRIYKVKADGTQGDLVTAVKTTADMDLWSGKGTGLTPDTEYFVEAKLRLTKKGFNLDYAFKSTDPLAKVKTTKVGNKIDPDE